MEWWQMALIGVAALVAGLLMGIFVHNLLRQRAKQRGMTQPIKREATGIRATRETLVERPAPEKPQVSEPEPETPEELLVAEEPVSEKPRVSEPEPETPEEPLVAEEPVLIEPRVSEPESRAPEEPVAAEPATGSLANLLEEIERNIDIANEPWVGKLNSFQTTVWEAIQDNVDNVPVDIYGEIKQIYIDIRLANSIVRLATEFNRRSNSLDDNYRKLCASIREKLERVKTLVERQ